MENNKSQLFEYMESGDWESAKPMLEDYLKSDISNVEKGELLVKATEAYIDAQINLNHQEIDLIKESLDILNNLDLKQRQVDDAAALAQARESLKD